ncbi:MAG: preprotein translocase subunit SecG [Desulfovibrio sp.]|nr:preprotein translocase subunit SecG [Desulfovibrio sp.]
MQTIILTLHIIVCVFLVILILLQAGKEGMGVIFGGGNTSVFGSAGAGGILVKLTTLMAVVFVITSLSYTYVTSSRPQSESAVLNVTIEESVTPAADKTPPQMPEGAPAIVPPAPSSAGGDKSPGGAENQESRN